MLVAIGLPLVKNEAESAGAVSYLLFPSGFFVLLSVLEAEVVVEGVLAV